MAIVRDDFQTLEKDTWASKTSCPYCFSINCRRCTRHGWRDFIRRFHGIFPWRCGVCGIRFYLPKRSQRRPDYKDRVLSAHYKIIETVPEETL